MSSSFDRREIAIAWLRQPAWQAAGKEPEKPRPDVPLHKRGFGVMDKDAP